MDKYHRTNAILLFHICGADFLEEDADCEETGDADEETKKRRSTRKTSTRAIVTGPTPSGRRKTSISCSVIPLPNLSYLQLPPVYLQSPPQKRYTGGRLSTHCPIPLPFTYISTFRFPQYSQFLKSYNVDNQCIFSMLTLILRVLHSG